MRVVIDIDIEKFAQLTGAADAMYKYEEDDYLHDADDCMHEAACMVRNALYNSDEIFKDDYEMARRAERIAELKLLWSGLGSVAIDDNECIDRQFFIWGKGTKREDIWHWFDCEYPDGVHALMFPGEEEPC